ncbi:hypothetical protein GPECTOR_13g703 [Gonium pectorale]|uniref:Enhancer of polycomb-like protein n=1 Tax=Gonium pectorale TaxID=33097 RepID=A0A150GMX1_GONPE|nr:hypothetical protein GPECTOR_13g703 [Gonium pectorale]|eukprot:KXZ51216.1 hypothetical protein GPECTOR_13g703 [Gonium pectorale]
MSSRTIRPRPLSYTERIPVVFLNPPKDAQDGDFPPVEPALEEFLKNCEVEREREQHGLLSGLEYSRNRKKGRKSAAAAQQPHRKSSLPAPGGADGSKPQAIAVPGCREVADYGANEEAMAQADARREAETAPIVPLAGLLPEVSPAGGALGGLGSDAAAYVIYQDVVRGCRAEPAQMQYDMDEQDDKVMAEVNAALQRAAGNNGASTGRQSDAGATRTPPATRSSSAAAAAALAAQLDPDSYEKLVGVLERAHFRALQQRKELWQADVKAGKVPKLPAADKILPWEAALAATKVEQPPLQPLPRALYNHWLKRRKQERGPLLGCLWYEQPWKAICFRSREPGCEGQQGDMPFMATETKNSTRIAWNRLRIDKKEARERLMEARDELELLRTMADQVRKRERLKKQLLKLHRAEMCAKARMLVLPRFGVRQVCAKCEGLPP